MRIECPACSAAYDVPPERLAPGRSVKCARCSATWSPIPGPESATDVPEPGRDSGSLFDQDSTPAPLAMPVALAPSPTPGPLPDPLPGRLPDRLPEPAAEPADHATPGATPLATRRWPAWLDRLRRPEARLAAAWLLTAVVLIGCAWAAIAYRTPIVGAWPPSARAYITLGLLPR